MKMTFVKIVCVCLLSSVYCTWMLSAQRTAQETKTNNPQTYRYNPGRHNQQQ